MNHKEVIKMLNAVGLEPQTKIKIAVSLIESVGKEVSSDSLLKLAEDVSEKAQVEIYPRFGNGE